jgi:hypothetical protein
VTGKVVVLAGGQPPAAEVSVYRTGRQVQAETDGSGRFTLKGVPVGVPFDLTVSAQDRDRFVPEPW